MGTENNRNMASVSYAYEDVEVQGSSAFLNATCPDCNKPITASLDCDPECPAADERKAEAHLQKARIKRQQKLSSASNDSSIYSPQKLRFWNRVATVLHFAQFVFMAAASVGVPKFRDFELNLTYSYFEEIDPNDSKLGLRTAVSDIGGLRIAPLCALFFLLSALFQGATTIGQFNAIYNADLERCQNRFRWYEYAISSSVMIWVIAMFTGVSDICALINIFAINACMNLFGLLMEHENSNSGRVTWRPFLFGCLAGLPPWISVMTSLAAGASPPGFVYGIFVSYIIMFCTFPTNMVLQFLKVGPWADYRFGEYVYILLSLIAKSLLGWLVFGGLNQPNSFNN